MTASNGTARHEAAAAWREAAATGTPPTATQLAARFGRSPRWGRQVIADARAATAPPAAATQPTSGPTAAPAASRAVERTTTTAAVAVVAAVAAVSSFEHQRHLALLAGEGWRAWLAPLAVDGLVLTGSMTLLAARRAGTRAGALPWLALLFGLGASLAANVAAARPTPVGRIVAAWPPVALALSFELLLRQGRSAHHR